MRFKRKYHNFDDDYFQSEARGVLENITVLDLDNSYRL